MVSDERGNRFKRSPRQDSQKRALSGRIGRVQVGAGSDQDGDGLTQGRPDAGWPQGTQHDPALH